MVEGEVGQEDNDTGRQKVQVGELSGNRALKSYYPRVPFRGKAEGLSASKEQARAASRAWTPPCTQGHREEQEVSGS